MGTGEGSGVLVPSLSVSLGRLSFFKGKDRLFLESFSFFPDAHFNDIFFPSSSQALCDPVSPDRMLGLWSHIERLVPGSSISSTAGTRRCSPAVRGKPLGMDASESPALAGGPNDSSWCAQLAPDLPLLPQESKSLSVRYTGRWFCTMLKSAWGLRN